jgi:hypothetical protein
MVSGVSIKEKKERKGWESGEKRREREQGRGKKTTTSIQGLRVNLEELPITFQVVIVESWSQTYNLQQFEQREGQDFR